MPSDPDALEQQLRAFGATLEQRTREPIVRSGAIPLRSSRRDRRRWATLGAAACVAALVVGLFAFGRGEPPEPGAADAPVETASTAAADATAALTTAAPPPTVAGPDPAFDPEQHVPDDPLGLVTDGWVLAERTVEGFAVDAEGSTCEGLLVLAALGDQPAVEEMYTNPDRAGFDLDVTYLPAATRGVVTAGLLAFAECPEIAELGAVSSVESDGVAGFRVGDEFALVAIAPEASEVPVAIVLELESVGVTDELIDDLVGRSVRFLTGGRDPGFPSRPITADERAALDGDAAGLTCDAFGIGAAEWERGPIDPSEPTGRVAADAFRDALDELRQDALREGGVPLPDDGWTELVVDDTSSVFVLEIDGVWQGRVDVAGDPSLGVWRHNSADLCQSLSVPDGVAPPTEPPTTPPITAPVRVPPATTAP
jgi:hypothetical protein